MLANVVFLACSFAMQPAKTGTIVPSEIATKDAGKLVGQLNVNTATESELLKLLDLDFADFAQLIAARAAGDITDLAPLHLSQDAQHYLKVDGESDLHRIRQLPLQSLQPQRTSHQPTAFHK